MKKIVTLLALALLLSTITVICCSCGNKVDLKDYVTVTFDGENGAGTANRSVDKDALDTLVEESKVTAYVRGISDEGALAVMLGGEYTLSDLLSIKLDGQTSSLSNGDKVTLIIDVDSSLEDEGKTIEDLEDALGISFASTEIEYTVEGLQ